MFLHAGAISFTLRGQEITVEAPWDQEWKNYVARLEDDSHV